MKELDKEKILHSYKGIANAMKRRQDITQMVEDTLNLEGSKFNIKLSLSFLKQAHDYDKYILQEFDGLQSVLLKLLGEPDKKEEKDG
jgi:hypothetical protein